MKLLILFCFSVVACTYGFPNRITGGQNSSIEQRPYQAVLITEEYDDDGQLYMKLSCGASIISSKYLLSAAHCAIDTSNEYARVGSSYINEGGQLLKVAEFYTHPLYAMIFFLYDFSIVTFANGEEIIFTANVQPIILNDGPDPEVDSIVTVSGWGVISEIREEPEILQEVDLPVWSNSRCRTVYPYITDCHICLGGTPEGGTSACYGDSGGPAVQGTPPIQYAVVSGGSSCTEPNIPAVYARVSYGRAWITEITGI